MAGVCPDHGVSHTVRRIAFSDKAFSFCIDKQGIEIFKAADIGIGINTAEEPQDFPPGYIGFHDIVNIGGQKFSGTGKKVHAGFQEVGNGPEKKGIVGIAVNPRKPEVIQVRGERGI
jgi:hypothetical protein